jgi:hypothetical protein
MAGGSGGQGGGLETAVVAGGSMPESKPCCVTKNQELFSQIEQAQEELRA